MKPAPSIRATTDKKPTRCGARPTDGVHRRFGRRRHHTREDDADALMGRLEREEAPFYVSPIMRLEATLSIARRLAGPDKPAHPDQVVTARRLVDQFIADLQAVEIPISGDIGTKALDAAQQFGKIVNHAARLNMGDCFAYARAAATLTRVAYKGDDFVHTDSGW